MFYLMTLSTHFIIWLYGSRHVVKNHSGNLLLPLHKLFFLINTKVSFIRTSCESLVGPGNSSMYLTGAINLMTHCIMSERFTTEPHPALNQSYILLSIRATSCSLSELHPALYQSHILLSIRATSCSLSELHPALYQSYTPLYQSYILLSIRATPHSIRATPCSLYQSNTPLSLSELHPTLSIRPTPHSLY